MSYDLPFIFSEQAAEEFRDSIDYYNGEMSGLGERFRKEVRSAITRIATFPLAFPEIEKEIRKCVLYRFPYNLLYSIEEDHILIIAVAHHHRQPEYWA